LILNLFTIKIQQFYFLSLLQCLNNQTEHFEDNKSSKLDNLTKKKVRLRSSVQFSFPALSQQPNGAQHKQRNNNNNNKKGPESIKLTLLRSLLTICWSCWGPASWGRYMGAPRFVPSGSVKRHITLLLVIVSLCSPSTSIDLLQFDVFVRVSGWNWRFWVKIGRFREGRVLKS
jgi:hypothetical protein